MNVNSHDLSYTLNLYQNMQVIVLPSNIIVTYTHTHPKKERKKFQNKDMHMLILIEIMKTSLVLTVPVFSQYFFMY